ncbi:MAG: hypothetical protein R2774_11440 [Saprospiraceae bacterium]
MKFYNIIFIFTLSFLACKKECETTEFIHCENHQITECLLGSWEATHFSAGFDYPLEMVEDRERFTFVDNLIFSRQEAASSKECRGNYHINVLNKTISFETDCFNIEYTFDISTTTFKLYKMGRHGLSTRQFKKI